VLRCALCFLCGREGREVYTGLTDWLFGAPGAWNLRSCTACAVMWLDPLPAANYLAELYRGYYTHVGAISPQPAFRSLRKEVSNSVLRHLGYGVERPRHLLPRLLSRIPAIERGSALDVLHLPASEIGDLLDVGCGDGRFVQKMRSLGWSASGVDLDPAAVTYGQSLGLNLLRGTISDVPREAKYDVITLGHVIEHVPDPVDLLRECRLRLREGSGRLVITTPNIRSLGHSWFRRHWRGLEIPRHLTLFSPASLVTSASRAGLRVTTIRTETRLAVRIHNASACARAGERNVSQRTRFNVGTKTGGYVFMLVENLLIYWNRNVGEEVYCVCMASDDKPNR
jgi:2-polyprenyl-3-methyl-5-hydroxy-6-metoxy-1,4-benzoquinol methylase